MNLKFLNQEIFFTTSNYACCNDLEISAASKQLHRLYAKHVIEKVTRGVWANINHPYYNPLGAVPYLLGREQGYVSFLTALHYHGVISQIPAKFQVATTGHTRKLISPIGHFEFFHLTPLMMNKGIEWSHSKSNYLIANAEKALLDALYISTCKGKRFSLLPEIDLEEVDVKYFKKLLKETIKSKITKSAIEEYFKNQT
ncbi:MAG: hypothetical protein HYY52_02625 [Candidatus Melainabacteria bacterium]|nr:hypothetical protein [Candidatus Melainabacteria bacterium]